MPLELLRDPCLRVRSQAPEVVNRVLTSLEGQARLEILRRLGGRWWAQVVGAPAIDAQTLSRFSRTKKIEELMNVKGIGEKSFLKLKALVTVAQNSDKPGER